MTEKQQEGERIKRGNERRRRRTVEKELLLVLVSPILLMLLLWLTHAAICSKWTARGARKEVTAALGRTHKYKMPKELYVILQGKGAKVCRGCCKANTFRMQRGLIKFGAFAALKGTRNYWKRLANYVARRVREESIIKTTWRCLSSSCLELLFILRAKCARAWEVIPPPLAAK